MEEQADAGFGIEFDTDAIIDVLEHLLKSEGSWGKHFADHGLDPRHVRRALGVVDVNQGYKAVAAAFGLGLQFGAMRLSPIELPEEERNCDCLICMVRRAAEGDQGGGAA